MEIDEISNPYNQHITPLPYLSIYLRFVFPDELPDPGPVPRSATFRHGTHGGHRLAVGPAQQLHQGGARHAAQTHLVKTRAGASPGMATSPGFVYDWIMVIIGI